MSLKRYALIAAVSQHQHAKQLQQQQHQYSSTSTTTTTRTKILTEELNESISETTEEDNTSINNNVTTSFNDDIIAPPLEPALVPPHLILNPIGVRNPNNGADIASNPSITTYYSGGGWGVFHQQNIRSSGITGNGINGITGIGGVTGNGGTGGYVHAINGNVNLLLGGAMLTLITTVLCVVCYCCHRNIKKRTEAEYRQQSQWMDNDPNMEIYTVEQCYETSGMFMAESTDGLSAMPTLSHEPPPSYDAVLAMQEQQHINSLMLQQQMQLQLQIQQQQQHNSPPPGYRSTLNMNNATTYDQSRHQDRDENGNLSGGDIDETTNHDGSNNNMLPWKFYTLNNKNSNLNAMAPVELMRKVLHAQSCCSLQRAEVENMWNAAAAAVAVRQHATRATHTTTSSNDSSCDNMLSETCFMMHNSLPIRRMLRHQQQQQHQHQEHHEINYEGGCRYCGKFRHNSNGHSMSLTASTDSGLNFIDNNNNNNNNNCNSNNNNDETPTTSNAINLNDNNNNNSNNNSEHGQCACSKFNADNLINEDLTNGNRDVQSTCKIYISQEADMENTTPNTNTNNSNENDNENCELECIDAINDNGIVRVDMSKIIDKTGLPTYEAALKFKSTGYV